MPDRTCSTPSGAVTVRLQKPVELDGVLRSALAHLYFVTVHPFEDGNGRLAGSIRSPPSTWLCAPPTPEISDGKRTLRAYQEVDRDGTWAEGVRIYPRNGQKRTGKWRSFAD